MNEIEENGTNIRLLRGNFIIYLMIPHTGVVSNRIIVER